MCSSSILLLANLGQSTRLFLRRKKKLVSAMLVCDPRKLNMLRNSMAVKSSVRCVILHGCLYASTCYVYMSAVS